MTIKKVEKQDVFVDSEGTEWKQDGPFCDLCGFHFGEIYNSEKGIKNPHGYESYDDNTCPNCGAEYKYNEGLTLVLTEKDLDLLRKEKGIE